MSDPTPPPKIPSVARNRLAANAIAAARDRLDLARHRLRADENPEAHRDYDACLAAYREALYGNAEAQ